VIGNDIVDLEVPSPLKSDRKKRFLDKVFTLQEKNLIDFSENPDVMIWRLWSMKESAYKIVNRAENKRSFAPLKLQCEIINPNEGVVRIDRHLINTKTIISKNYIRSVATNSSKNRIVEFLIKFDSNNQAEQSQILHENLMNIVGATYQIPKENLTLKKNNFGVPVLWYKNNSFDVDFSLSHHGKFGFIVLHF
jgi:phosphopantetheinyl transferase